MDNRSKRLPKCLKRKQELFDENASIVKRCNKLVQDLNWELRHPYFAYWNRCCN